MATDMTLKELLDVLLRMEGTFILQNEHGSMELRGNDLYLHPYREWLTIYHATPTNPESQSHLHLKWQTLRSAVIVHEAGQTPHLAFYRTAEPVGAPPLVWYFPSFYNWANNKANVAAHQAQYKAFVQNHGRVVHFIEPAAVVRPED
ncbi:hypothetical protein NKDENANG_03480 [Candidatus Entotheonellaceae bacterium PAL068K]